MKSFVVINEDFICKNCSRKVNRLKGGCRNHCPFCLYSMHLDQNSPGDRLSQCHSLMAPISVSHSGKKGWVITHRCLNCRKEINNKSADDDNFELISEISSNSALI